MIQKNQKNFQKRVKIQNNVLYMIMSVNRQFISDNEKRSLLRRKK